MASAWLIRRFIDPEARFLWLKSAADCPKKAVGFDFDGATFSHVGSRVTFENLLVAFSLETPALLRLGVVVHGLDAGGVQPPEAAGVERVLAGMRDAITNDDQLLLAAAGVFGAVHKKRYNAAPACSVCTGSVFSFWSKAKNPNTPLTLSERSPAQRISCVIWSCVDGACDNVPTGKPR